MLFFLSLENTCLYMTFQSIGGNCRGLEIGGLRTVDISNPSHSLEGVSLGSDCISIESQLGSLSLSAALLQFPVLLAVVPLDQGVAGLSSVLVPDSPAKPYCLLYPIQSLQESLLKTLFNNSFKKPPIHFLPRTSEYILCMGF